MKLNDFFKKATPIVLSLYLTLLVLHLYQFIKEPSQYMGQPVLVEYHLKGIVMDLEFALLISLVGFLLSILFLKILGKYSILLFHITSVVAIVANFSLLTFFLETHQPLGKVFFEMKVEELAMAADLSLYITAKVILVVLGLIILYFSFFFLFRKISEKPISQKLILVLWLISIAVIPWSVLKTRNTVSDIVANNKTLFFLDGGRQFYFKSNQDNLPFIDEDFQAMDLSFFQNKKPDNEEYPFFHSLPDSSSLNQFLNHDPETPPNIVFLIVESLSNQMYGEQASASGHMMTFLDSLSKEGIYYPNFLSTCQRTYNVLPASLASTPNPPNGMELQSGDFPPHWSLISLLNKAYYSRYYCGVPMNYANMGGYMNYHNVDYLVSNFGKQFSDVIGGKNNPWGYPDGELFEQSFIDLNRLQIKQPRLDVFLTMSTHAPFMIPNQKHYLNRVQQKFKHSKAEKSKQEYALKKPESLATYVYTDESLKEYFKIAKQAPDFNNTIYFIFGDHGNHDLLFSGLDRFKTSLIIYSPLLKKPQTIRSVSTHLDLAPSILNFLRLNYPNLNLPSRVPFFGGELSTNPLYECKRTLPLISEHHENIHLVMGEYLLMDGALYKLEADLKPSPINNEEKRSKLIKQLDLYNRLVKYLFNWDRLIPESIFYAYVDKINYDFVYREITNPDKTKSSLEFIDIGNFSPLVPSWKKIKLECTLEAKITKANYVDSFPKLTFSIENIVENKENELVIWKQTKGRLMEKFVPNGWNKITFATEISFTDIPKILKDNKFSFYLLNTKKEEQEIRNIDFRLFSVN